MERINPVLTDPEIAAELGRRLRSHRTRQRVTLNNLAREAGISRLTLGKLERGQNVTVETLLRVLRALRQLDTLDAILSEPAVSPLALLQAQRETGRQPTRVRAKGGPKDGRKRLKDGASQKGRSSRPGRDG